MRGVDVLLAFPGLLLALLIINLGTKRLAIGESWLIIMTIGIAFMPNNSRVIRSAALAIKPLEFVQNARLRGESALYIIFREVLPNVFPIIGVEASIRVSFALLLTAGLGFLGLGVQPRHLTGDSWLPKAAKSCPRPLGLHWLRRSRWASSLWASISWPTAYVSRYVSHVTARQDDPARQQGATSRG